MEVLSERGAAFEQEWVFEEAPAPGGDLVVALEVVNARVTQASDGVRFAGEAGFFKYSHAIWIDARGVRTAVQAVATSDSVRLTVPAEVLGASRFPARLDPTLSAEFPLTPVRSYSAPSISSSRAELSFNGTNFLATWREWDSTLNYFYIVATRITPAGDVLDPAGIVLAERKIPNYQGRVSDPRVASDGNSWVVVWSDTPSGTASPTTIRAARVAGDGTFVEFPISLPGWMEAGGVAYGGGTYLVTWSITNGFTPTLYTAAVLPAGIPTPTAGIAISYGRSCDLDFDGTNFFVAGQYQGALRGWFVAPSGFPISTTPISIPGTRNYAEDCATVAFDGTNHAVVWNESGKMLATRISPAGAVLDSPAIVLQPSVEDQSLPVVAVNGSKFFVAWVAGQTRERRLSRLGGSLALEAQVTLGSGAAGSLGSGMLEVGGGTVLTIDARHLNGFRLLATRFDTNLAPLGQAEVPVSIAATPQDRPSLAFGGGAHVVVWEEQRAADRFVHGARIADGASLDPAGVELSDAGWFYQMVASADGGFFAVWPEGTATGTKLLGALLDLDGGLSAQRLLLRAGFANQAWAPVLVSNGAEYLVAWSGGAVRVSADGLLLDSQPISIPVTGYEGRAGASNGTDFLLIDDRRAINVTAAGVASSPGPPVFKDSSGGGYALGARGSGYYVVRQSWQPDGGGELEGFLLGPSGQRLGTTPFIKEPVRLDNHRAGTAFDGTSFLIAWTSPEGNARAARFAPDGTLLGMFTIADRASSPAVAPAAEGWLAVYASGVRSRRAAGRIIHLVPIESSCVNSADCRSSFCIDSVCCDAADGGGPGACARPPCEGQQGVCAGTRHLPSSFHADGGWNACGVKEYGAAYEGSESLLDGLDNDCDGLIDYFDPDVQPHACELDIGVCAGALHTRAELLPDGGWKTCGSSRYGTDYEPAESSVDGLDNDCDGLVDHLDPDVPPLPCERQAGVCSGARHARSGYLSDGGWSACGSSDYGAGYEQVESRVDGLDNDCDGLVDYDDPELPLVACELTKGVCTGAMHPRGQFRDGGWDRCTRSEYGTRYQSVETFCDGLDNDCNGIVDEHCQRRPAVADPPPRYNDPQAPRFGCSAEGGAGLLGLLAWLLVYPARRSRRMGPESWSTRRCVCLLDER